MKNKKFNKKLSLNKTTVANLGQGSMRGIRGGDLPTGGIYTCSPKCGTNMVTGCIPCEDPTATCDTLDAEFTCLSCDCHVTATCPATCAITCAGC